MTFLFYCKLALRHLARRPTTAFINISGLAIGLACFILFGLYALNELSYDRFHQRAADIYRVYEWGEGLPGRPPSGIAGLSMAMGPALQQDFGDDIESMVRFRKRDNVLVRGPKGVDHLPVSYADASFFSVFTFPLRSGNASRALSDPFSVVLTRDMARRLFGREDVVGERVDIKTDSAFVPFQVSAVAENPPPNTVLPFGILVSYNYVLAHADKESLTDWYETAGDETYVLLHPGSTLPRDPRRLVAFRSRHLPQEGPDLVRQKQWDGRGIPPITFRLQPLRDIHFSTDIDQSMPPVDPSDIWILLGIATGVLLIACINFTTLSIGRSADRAKEIGMRKVIGGLRRQLVLGFLTESVVLAFLSALLGLLLAFLMLPFFNGLASTTLVFSFRQFVWLPVLILLTGLLAGSYPALVLSGFKPLEVLRSRVKLKGANYFTRSLVVLQFTLSSGLIIGTVIVLQQVAFMRSSDPGFKKENVIVLDASGTNVYPLLKQTLSSDPRVLSVAASQVGLGAGQGFMGGGFTIRGKDGFALEYPVDGDYIRTMGMTVLRGDARVSGGLSGRFSKWFSGDMIVNEAFLQEYGIPVDSALGQMVSGRDGHPRVITGVVKDFNYTSLHDKVGPQVFTRLDSSRVEHIYIRVGSFGALASILHAWKVLVPGFPCRYSFLDEDVNHFYDSETRWSHIIGWAGGISVCLACLGLFGLAALVAVNRTKEIGIRKVLGASVMRIVGMLSVDFLWMVGLAWVLSAPIVWYFGHRWLEGYAYRIGLQWWVFVLVGLAMAGVALMTVGARGVRAASRSLVEALRVE